MRRIAVFCGRAFLSRSCRGAAGVYHHTVLRVIALETKELVDAKDEEMAPEAPDDAPADLDAAPLVLGAAPRAQLMGGAATGIALRCSAG